MDPVNSSFHINGIEVIPDAGLIRTASGEHRLPVRLMKLLCLLVDAQGATVDREKLVDALWPRGFVNEEALSKAIAELRRHLGDDARAPRFIETVPKRGYRMVASPTPNPPAHSTAARSRRLLPLFGVLLVLAGSTAFYFFTARDSVVTPAISASAIQLTADSEMQYHPELSPDGQWLAFIRNETGSGQLNIMPAVGLTESRVISGDLSIWSPTFSPDAGKLAVASLDEDSCTILEILINNAAIQPLGSCKLPSNSPILDWSSDGTKLAYVDKAAGSEHAAIWQMRLSDGQRRQLTKPPDEYSFDTRPRYSADGTTLSFTRGTRASRDLWLLDLTIPDDGSLPEPRRLTFDNQFTTGHDWRDDGNGIVLDSERSGFKALWEVDLDGRWSLLGARDAQSPTLAGNKMVFKISQYESNIWQLTPQGTLQGEQPLLSSTKYDSNPTWSPDGEEIAFSSNRTGRGSIWIASADGSRERLVYEPVNGRVVWPTWSPDSNHLLATRYDDKGQNLVRIALNQREVKVIPTVGEHPYAGRYSADGRWIYYIASEGVANVRLWRQPGSGIGEAQVVTTQPVNNFSIIGDRWIIYTKQGSPGMFSATIEAPRLETVLIENFPSSAWADWTTVKNWVYFPSMEDSGDIVLKRMAVTGGEPQKISDHFPTALGPNLAVHPQSGSVLLARTDRAQSDLFLVSLGQEE